MCYQFEEADARFLSVASHFTLKREAAGSSEILVYYHNSIRRHSSDNIDLNLNNCGNLKSLLFGVKSFIIVSTRGRHWFLSSAR